MEMGIVSLTLLPWLFVAVMRTFRIPGTGDVPLKVRLATSKLSQDGKGLPSPKLAE